MHRRICQIGFLLLLPLVIALNIWVAPANASLQEQQLVSEVWRIIDRAYVDSTFNHQNWWSVRQRSLRQPLNTQEEAYTAIQSMLATLEDPFTRLLKPDQYRNLQTNTAGELTGIGLQVAMDAATGALEVITPIAGSPAEQAGIRPRDRILSIDGVPTTQLTLDEAAEQMRGIVGSLVTLKIKRSDSDPLEFILKRGRIELNPVTANLQQTADQTPIGYIRLSQFSANAATEVAHALRRLKTAGAQGYILDLRNNPGGLLQAGVEIARFWLDTGTIVYTVNRQGVMGSFDAIAPSLTQAPLVVLVNQGTASASEILAGALQDNGRAQLVGETTFGKGLIQSLFELPDGSGLAVTVAKYETPQHRDINKLGIQPDLHVPQEPIRLDQVATTDDHQYQAAMELLTHSSVLAGAA